MGDLIERLRVEPTASHFLRVGDLVESLVAERKEAANRIAALEAEKAERERQEPILWWDGDKIVSENRKYLFPFVNPPQPLYAHPLALREPTEDECVSLACRVDELLGDPSRQTDAEYGRAMWQAVREVMTK